MNKQMQIRNALLGLLGLIFAVLVWAIWSQAARTYFYIFASLAVIFGLLGLLLVALTLRLAESRTRKILFALAGCSAAGIPFSILMHNLVYGWFIAWFGQEVWGPGGDEPIFFVLALIVCPVLFAISAGTSAVLLLRTRHPQANGKS